MSCANFQELLAGQGAGTETDFTPANIDFPYDSDDELRLDIYNYQNQQWVNVPLATGATINVGGAGDRFYAWETYQTDGQTGVRTILATAGSTPALPGGQTASHPLVPANNVYPVEGGAGRNVRLYRQTSIDAGELPAYFYPGASIRAQDLNDNFEAIRKVVEESNCATNNINDGSAQLDARYWNKVDADNNGDTYTSASTGAWPNNDTTIATTAAGDDRWLTGGGGAGGALTGGDGITVAGATISVDLDNPSGLEFDGGELRVDANDGLAIDANGLNVTGNQINIGTVRFGGVGNAVYTFPTTDGASGRVLSTDGAGTLSWVANGSGGSGATYEMTVTQSGGTDADPNLFLDASTGTDSTIQIVGGNDITVTRNSDTQLTIASTATGDSYDLNATADGDNVDLNLTSGSGTDNSVVQLTAGAGVSLTRNSASEITIANTAGALDFQGTVDISDAATIPANAAIGDAFIQDDDVTTVHADWNAILDPNQTSANAGDIIAFSVARVAGGAGGEAQLIPTGGTNTTYTLPCSADGGNAVLTLTGSDTSTDPVTITAGTNVNFSNIGAAGFTINSTAGGGALWSRAGTVLSPNTAGDDVRLTDGGQLQFAGDTSGQIDIRTDATAGTYALILPDDTPAVGEVLTVESMSGTDATLEWAAPTGQPGTVTQIATNNGLAGGPITNSGTIGIANDGVTFARMQNLSQNRIIGRVDAGDGDPTALTAAQVRTMINVANGADVANNGQININAGNGITAAGDNATANQAGNTTRTLSVNAHDGITVDANGVSVNAANNTINVAAGGISVNQAQLTDLVAVAGDTMTGNLQMDGASVIADNGETVPDASGNWDIQDSNVWQIPNGRNVDFPDNTAAPIPGQTGIFVCAGTVAAWDNVNGGTWEHPGGTAQAGDANGAIIPFYVQTATNIILGTQTVGS